MEAVRDLIIKRKLKALQRMLSKEENENVSAPIDFKSHKPMLARNRWANSQGGIPVPSSVIRTTG